MRNISCWLVTAGALLILPSCAAILGSTSEEIAFNSNPQGARVIVGEQEGVTPCVLEVDKSIDELTMIHDGEEVVMEFDSSFGVGWLLLDLFFTPLLGIPAMVTDGVTGAWNDFPNLVSYDFVARIAEGAIELITDPSTAAGG